MDSSDLSECNSRKKIKKQSRKWQVWDNNIWIQLCWQAWDVSHDKLEAGQAGLLNDCSFLLHPWVNPMSSTNGAVFFLYSKFSVYWLCVLQNHAGSEVSEDPEKSLQSITHLNDTVPSCARGVVCLLSSFNFLGIASFC